jgi:phage/plasmid-associated DNA primase
MKNNQSKPHPKWENVLVEREQDFIKMGDFEVVKSNEMQQPIPMTKYDHDNEKPMAMQLIEDPTTHNYIVLSDDGSRQKRMEKELEEEIRAEVENAVMVNELKNEKWEVNHVETPEKNYWLHFYASSLSIVGLFILFRMIQKSS